MAYDFEHLKIPNPDPAYEYTTKQPQSCDEIEAALNDLDAKIVSDSIGEPPDDGLIYVRTFGAWILSTCGPIVIPPDVGGGEPDDTIWASTLNCGPSARTSTELDIEGGAPVFVP